MKVITVGMGKNETVKKFRDKLRQIASRGTDGVTPLAFEADFQYLDAISNNIVKEACNNSSAAK